MADRKRTEPDWQDLRIFLALGRHGSLSGAARSLGVNHATIARRLRSLEDDVGVRLVERRPDGYALTEAGGAVLAAASDMEAAARRIGHQGGADAPRGLVRINAPPALAHGFLIARMADLATRHPGLDIDIATDIRAISLDRHQADIAIRLSRPDDGDIIARRLATIGYGFYATPDWCARIGDGAEPVFVGFDEADAHVPEAVWLARQFPRSRVAFRATNQAAQAIAARSGAGIALLPHYIGRAETMLKRCTLGGDPPPREAFMLTRPRDRGNLPVRIVAEHIAEAFRDAPTLFE